MASTHSELDGDELDLTGLVESIVDSDEDDDLAESMDVSQYFNLIQYFLNRIIKCHFILLFYFRVLQSEIGCENVWKKIRQKEQKRI